MTSTMRSRSVLLGACVMLACVPPAMTGVLIRRFTHDVPTGDSWYLVPVLRSLYDGELEVRQFWAAHNEHRIVFPKLIFAALAWASDWNPMWEVTASFAVALAFFSVIVLGLRSRAPRADRVSFDVAVPLLSLLVFSLIQYANWLNGWQFQIFLNVFAVSVVAFSLSARRRAWTGFLVALFAAIVASFSFANGLLVWFCAIPSVLFLAEAPWRLRWIRTGIWTGVGAVTIAAYLWGLDRPADHPPANGFLTYLEYILVYLGTPVFGWNQTGALIAGATGIAVVATLLGLELIKRPSGFSSIAPFLVLFGYALTSATLTGFGRAGYGLVQAASSRYTTIGNLLWIALVGVSVVCADRLIRVRRVGIALLATGGAALGLLVVANNAHGYKQGGLRYEALIPFRDNLVHDFGLDFLTTELYPNSVKIPTYQQYARERGLAAFSRSHDYRPEHADAFIGRGNGLAQEGETDKALRMYRAATTLAPNNPRVHRHLGQAYLAQGEYAEAVEAFDRALSIDGTDAIARADLGRAYHQLGQLEDAERNLRLALTQDGESARLCNALGLVLMDLDRLSQAQTQLERAIELEPEFTTARVNYGNLLLRLNRPQDAARQYRTAISTDPGYANAWSGLGTAFLVLGELSNAVTSFENALAIRPEDAMTRTNLAVAYLSQGNPDAARREATRALADDPAYAKAERVLERLNAP